MDPTAKSIGQNSTLLNSSDTGATVTSTSVDAKQPKSLRPPEKGKVLQGMGGRNDQTLHADPTLDRNTSQASIQTSRSTTSNSQIIRLKHQELYNQHQSKHNIPRQKSQGAGAEVQGAHGPPAAVGP